VATGDIMQKELLVRKSIRLKDYDYSSTGDYFVTICVKDGHMMLGEINNGKMILNGYGNTVKYEIENIHLIRKECIVEKYVIMPNHLHLIVQIVGDDGNRPSETYDNRVDCHQPLRRSIPNMVQGLKGAVTRRIGFSLWQRSYHDHIIRDEAQ